MDIRKLDQPLNSNERYLHGINVRLEILIQMFSSFLDVYANQNEIATEKNVVVEEVKVEEEVVNYESLTKKQLMQILDYREIEYDSRAVKADLIELLKE